MTTPCTPCDCGGDCAEQIEAERQKRIEALRKRVDTLALDILDLHVEMMKAQKK